MIIVAIVVDYVHRFLWSSSFYDVQDLRFEISLER